MSEFFVFTCSYTQSIFYSFIDFLSMIRKKWKYYRIDISYIIKQAGIAMIPANVMQPYVSNSFQRRRCPKDSARIILLFIRYGRSSFYISFRFRKDKDRSFLLLDGPF